MIHRFEIAHTAVVEFVELTSNISTVLDALHLVWSYGFVGHIRPIYLPASDNPWRLRACVRVSTGGMSNAEDRVVIESAREPNVIAVIDGQVRFFQNIGAFVKNYPAANAAGVSNLQLQKGAENASA